MIELYHNDMSTCAQKVRLALEEKSLAWQGHHLDLRAGDQLQPAYLELNPRGVVPTLVDGGRPVCESTIIMEYLEDEYPQTALRPADSWARSRMRQWTKRLDEGHHDVATGVLSIGVAFRYQYLAKGKEALDAMLAKFSDPLKRARRHDIINHGVEAQEFRTAVLMWEKLLSDMEAALSRTPWLAGDAYTLADTAWTPYLTRLDHLNLLRWIAARPALAAWYARVRERPSYAAAIVKWNNPKYLELMRDKGDEAWPRIRTLLAAA